MGRTICAHAGHESSCKSLGWRRLHAFVLAALGLSGVMPLDGFIHHAHAQEQPAAAQIIDALRPKGGVRAPTLTPAEQRKASEDRQFAESLRSKAARALTLSERTKVAEIARTKPAIDLEVNFNFNKDTVNAKAVVPLVQLGVALRDAALKDAIVLLGGHTDAKGSAEYNRGLSERRAAAVKRFLVEKFRLSAENLVSVGYGKEQLKNTSDPYAAENRRVQIVNLSAQ